MGRVIALDHGAARCGVAATDPSRTIVSPKDPILKPDSDDGFAEILRLVADLEADGVLVGLPLALSGEESSQSVVARNFASRVASAIAPAWVEMMDERHSTSEAKARGGVTSEDSRAAAVLLERWLEANPQ
mgnify:CR=1 FL=1